MVKLIVQEFDSQGSIHEEMALDLVRIFEDGEV